MSKATKDRWQSAQSYERGHWERQAEAVADDEYHGIDWYDWRAEFLVSCLKELGLDHLANGDSNLIEVGSGPVGVVAHIPGQIRVAIDPLGDFYGEHPELTTHRDPGVDYKAGMGEELDAPDDTFDLAIIENCIDHVRDTDAVMQELQRVLRPAGTLYLTVNLRTPWGYW
ncbi:MAG: class I SAM-dependent methyltransferase, partial [Longimicrobiales bacterium]